MTIGCKNKSETAPQVTPKIDYNTTAIINVNYPAVFEKKLLFDGKTIKKEKKPSRRKTENDEGKRNSRSFLFVDFPYNYSKGVVPKTNHYGWK